MNRIGYYWTVVLLVFGLVFAVVDLFAAGPDVVGTPVAIFTNEAVNPSSSATSSAWTKVGNTKVQSCVIVVSGDGGDPAGYLEVKGSHDGTNYYYPTVGQTLVTITAAGGSLVPIDIPVTPYVKFLMQNTSATVTLSCTVTAIPQ